jgi:hypothetical protein
MSPMRSSRTRRLLLRLTRLRCPHPFDEEAGLCHICFRFVLEEHVALLHPTMKLDEVVERVNVWIAQADLQRRDIESRA